MVTLKIIGLVIAFVTFILWEGIKTKNAVVRTSIQVITVIILIFGLGMAIVAEIIQSDIESKDAKDREDQYKTLVFKSEKALNYANENLEISAKSLDSLAEIQRISRILNDSLNHEIAIQRELNETAKSIFESQQTIQTDTRRLLNPIPDSLALKFTLAIKLCAFFDSSLFAFYYHKKGMSGPFFLNVDTALLSILKRKVINDSCMFEIAPQESKMAFELNSYRYTDFSDFSYRDLDLENNSISWTGNVDVFNSGTLLYAIMHHVLYLETPWIPIRRFREDVKIRGLDDLKGNYFVFYTSAMAARVCRIQLKDTKNNSIIGYWMSADLLPSIQYSTHMERNFIK